MLKFVHCTAIPPGNTYRYHDQKMIEKASILGNEVLLKEPIQSEYFASFFVGRVGRSRPDQSRSE